MASERQAHWQGVYTTKGSDAVSWFQPSPEPSLRMMDALGIKAPASLIDVGGGASTLVDELVARGFKVTVLDIADAALAISRERLGEAAKGVEWRVVDITIWRPDRVYDVWHDRAVFHFLTEAGDRERYIAALKAGLAPGGAAIFATFAEDGPERCSGLPVVRYSADTLATELGPDFALAHHTRETHLTPWGSEQSFTWAGFRRAA
ncbi:class I SAM-dependent methyltransferase [Sphingomonas sp.]|uniref:class I SAM-dependent methyltransferase n=1 Tax=Sphingomonas sp. TaxID=28214 RepID=UPI002FCBC722